MLLFVLILAAARYNCENKIIMTDAQKIMITTPSIKPRIDEIEDRIVQLKTPQETQNRNYEEQSLTIYTPTSTDLVIHDPERFHFLSPKSNLRKFESEVLKRQAEYSSRISDLEGRLALFHARLALESAERGRELASTSEEFVNVPLEEAMRRSLEKIETQFVRPILDPKAADELQQKEQDRQGDDSHGGDETDGKDLPNIVSIERRVNLLEAQMNYHNHVTLFNSRRTNYDTIDATCRQTLQPSLALEMTKADKREGGLIRRFQSAAGEYTRRLAELQSARVASLGYLQKKVDAWDLSDASRIESHLAEIQKLKEIVLEERRIRMRQDELVVDTILNAKGLLQEGIFDVVR